MIYSEPEAADAVASYRARLDGLRARTMAARAALGSGAAAVTSRDGAVSVTASATGEVTGLSFGPDASGLPLTVLAAVTVRTLQQARLEAMQRTQSAVAEVMGPSSPAVLALGDQVEQLRESLTEPAESAPGGSAAVRRLDFDDPDDDSGLVVRRGY